MNKQSIITAVKPIFFTKNIDKAFVVFELATGESISRRPKQALTDLQNSGRALHLNPESFNKGLQAASRDEIAELMDVLFECQDAVLSGDWNKVKAGDSYVVAGDHPAYTDKTNKNYGRIKDGKLIAEKDGIYVEGFLQIPLTRAERFDNKMAKQTSIMYLQMMNLTGKGVSMPVATLIPEANISGGQSVEDIEAELENATINEAFGAGKE